jgi:hypothetical protein
MLARGAAWLTLSLLVGIIISLLVGAAPAIKKLFDSGLGEQSTQNYSGCFVFRTRRQLSGESFFFRRKKATKREPPKDFFLLNPQKLF